MARAGQLFGVFMSHLPFFAASSLALQTGSTVTQPAAPTAAPVVPTSGADIGLLIALIGGGVAMLVVGGLFLAKKRRERLAVLTELSLQLAAEGESAGDKVPVQDAADHQDAQAVVHAAQTQTRPTPKPLGAALSRTRAGLMGRIGKALTGRRDIDASVLDELEEVLFTADIGVRTAQKLLEAVREELKGKALADGDAVQAVIRREMTTILRGVESQPLAMDGPSPRVFMMVGVNGVGKTTSIGKLAHQFKEDGKSVLMGAGDTFRAAAVEQLAVWAERADCPIVRKEEGADPSSVLFDAVKQARETDVDVVLCDTAGRLHTKVNLMDELSKVRRVLGKSRDGAPDETLLVLDATTGQNAIAQARQFSEAVPLTGIILTKLDGTAKGGVVLGIADELGIPVRYIGVGEGMDDLRPFDPEAFVEALFLTDGD